MDGPVQTQVQAEPELARASWLSRYTLLLLPENTESNIKAENQQAVMEIILINLYPEHKVTHQARQTNYFQNIQCTNYFSCCCPAMVFNISNDKLEAINLLVGGAKFKGLLIRSPSL